MKHTIWTPDQGYPDGARARDYLRKERLRERAKWQRIREIRDWQHGRFPLQAAIAVGASPSFKTGTAAGSGAVTEPASSASGDIFLAWVVIGGSSTALTRPSGWTNLLNGTSTTSHFDYDLSWIARGGSPPAGMTWTWTTSNYYEVHILRFTGVDNVSPIDAQGTIVKSASAADGPNRASSDVDCPACVAATTNTMAVAIACQWSGSVGSIWSAPTNYTMRSNNALGEDGMLATRLLSATGSENPDEFFCTTNVPEDMVAFTLTLKEASASATIATGLGASSLTGQGNRLGFGINMPPES